MLELVLIGFLLVIFVLVIVGTVGFVAPSLPAISSSVFQTLPSATGRRSFIGVMTSLIERSRISWIEILFALVIYESSTVDIFMNGFENSPWLPLGLGILAMTGILAGVIWRLRGVLLLGSVFLLVSITTMIWYLVIEDFRVSDML